jgi:hypothetical protein
MKKHLTSSYAKTEHQKKTSKKELDKVLIPSLEASNTAPSLNKAILKILLKWREGKMITPSDHPSIFGIREAIKDQNNRLGWDNFVLGRWSPKWQLAQQQFFIQTKSKRTSKRCTTSIIHKLFINSMGPMAVP